MKHLVIAALVVSAAVLMPAVNRRVEAAAGNDEKFARWQERRQDLADVNLLPGLVILGLTAIATAIPAGG